MKKLTLSLVVLITLFSQAIFAQTETSSYIKMDRYQLGSAGDVFLVEHDGWELTSCPGARHARLNVNHANFDLLFSSILLAYSEGSSILIYGECDAPNADFLTVTYLLMETDLTE